MDSSTAMHVLSLEYVLTTTTVLLPFCNCSKTSRSNLVIQAVCVEIMDQRMFLWLQRWRKCEDKNRGPISGDSEFLTGKPWNKLIYIGTEVSTTFTLNDFGLTLPADLDRSGRSSLSSLRHTMV